MEGEKVKEKMVIVMFMVMFPSSFLCILAALFLFNNYDILAGTLVIVGAILFVVSGIITDGFGGSER